MCEPIAPTALFEGRHPASALAPGASQAWHQLVVLSRMSPRKDEVVSRERSPVNETFIAGRASLLIKAASESAITFIVDRERAQTKENAMAALALRLAEVALTALVAKALDEMWDAARRMTLSNG